MLTVTTSFRGSWCSQRSRRCVCVQSTSLPAMLLMNAVILRSSIGYFLTLSILKTIPLCFSFAERTIYQFAMNTASTYACVLMLIRRIRSIVKGGVVGRHAGKVQVVLTSDSLVHFQWVDRTSGEVVEDVIVFPTEAKLVALPQPRCYTLKFGQGTRPQVTAVRRHLGAFEC